ncbi:class I SAM-dependent methyltransferase, partial [Candidatus Bipolaricaulota bacterium]|nr:class I SAM-dependent methyltransferase [Candidatus Bipolaricaulota bacterium]
VEDYPQFYRGIANALPALGEAPKILDLGVGTGLELDHLFERFPNASVTGIDVSAAMLDKLAGKNRPWVANLHLITDSFLDLDLGCGVYDAVISSMVLHHWIPRVKLELYRRIYRALLPDGTFINGDFIVSEDESSQRLALFAEARLDERHRQHIDLPLSLDQELRLLAEAGFAHIATPFKRPNVAILNASKR